MEKSINSTTPDPFGHLATLALQGIADLGIASGMTNPGMNEEDFDRFHRGFLERGAMFNNWLETMMFFEALNEYSEHKRPTPFLSPEDQVYRFETFVGLLSFCKFPAQLAAVANQQPMYMSHVPETKSIAKLRDRIRTKRNTFPQRVLLAYSWDDPAAACRYAYDYLAWHHRASYLFPEYFHDKHLAAMPNIPRYNIGFHVFQLPEQDWEEGIGASLCGKSVEEAKLLLEEGYQLMGWEGMQFFALQPHYALLMATSKVPNPILPGLCLKQHLDSDFSIIPSIRFGREANELQFTGVESRKAHDLYGCGVVKYLGPLKKFL